MKTNLIRTNFYLTIFLIFLNLILVYLTYVIAWPQLKSIYFIKKVSYNKEHYKKINKFTTMVNISYFTNLLGEPEFVNLSKNARHKEYIFVEEKYLTQVITNNKRGNEKVISFAITATDEYDFNPTLSFLNNEKIVLGKTKFEEIKYKPASYNGMKKSNWMHYYEIYETKENYYDNYILGINLLSDFPFYWLLYNDEMDFGTKIKNKSLKNIRNSEINTYCVINNPIKTINEFKSAPFQVWGLLRKNYK